jgi:hypothetical protein
MFLQMGLDSDFPQSLSGKSKREVAGSSATDRATLGSISSYGASAISSAFGRSEKKTPGHQAGRRSRKAITSVAKQWAALCGNRPGSSVHFLTLPAKQIVCAVLPKLEPRHAYPEPFTGSPTSSRLPPSKINRMADCAITNPPASTHHAASEMVGGRSL